MPLYNSPNLTSGIDTTIITTTQSVPVFTPMLLIFIFGVVLIGGSISQKRRMGTADLPMWATIASLSTLMIAMPMSLTVGLIDIYTLGIVFTITILSGFWLFTSRNRNEM